ncbi:MAG: ABC transporter ATP-binding protein [Anaerolineae bacterium]|nr:ABC transporter ATP-binding protein [Anaerolineae bacterium]
MTDQAICTQNLTRSFGSVQAVNGLSFTVDVGEVFGFLGHNGAGKTTTVRLLNGVLMPDSGESTVLGYDPVTEGTALRARTGVLTETPSLDERLTAVDNLTFYADLYGVPATQVRQRVAAVLETFGLAERGGDKVGGYSKGMKQRLALARAFLHEPELIFLDEPTSGLDPVAAQEVHEMIRHVSRDEGRTVFLCTHNLVEAQRLCDRVGVMEHGHLVAVGTPHELAHQIGAKIRYTLEIAPDQLKAAQEALTRMTAVDDVREDDDGLSISVSDREVIPTILAHLIAAQIRVYAVTPQQVSLEDIYMTLHKRAEDSR